MRRCFLVLLCLLPMLGLKANHWEPDPYLFPDNMNVVGVIEINGLEQTSETLELGAFCETECRGSEILTYYQGLNRYLVFMTIYGTSGDEFTFRLYDHDIQLELIDECGQTITFIANQVVGTVAEPYVFAFTRVLNLYNVDARPVPDTAGVVVGMGNYYENDTCTLSATANEGYTFVEWSEDGQTVSTSPEFTFAVTSNRALVAHFSLNPNSYVVAVAADPVQGGTVQGGGEYVEGETCVIKACPSPNYGFAYWVEGETVVSTEPEWSFVVEGNRSFVAHFRYYDVLMEQGASLSVFPNPTEGRIQVGGLDGEPLRLFDEKGRLLMETSIHADPILLDLGSLPAGCYFLKAGAAVKKVLKR